MHRYTPRNETRGLLWPLQMDGIHGILHGFFGESQVGRNPGPQPSFAYHILFLMKEVNRAQRSCSSDPTLWEMVSVCFGLRSNPRGQHNSAHYFSSAQASKVSQRLAKKSQQKHIESHSGPQATLKASKIHRLWLADWWDPQNKSQSPALPKSWGYPKMVGL